MGREIHPSMIRALLTSLLVVMATDIAIRHAECGVGCRRGGWDDGAFRPKEKDCYCVDYVEFESVTGKRLTMPSRPRKSAAPEPEPQARPANTSFPWSF